MASTIPVICTHCHKESVGPPELAGKKVRCKSCRKIFTVSKPQAPKAKAAATIKKAVEEEIPSVLAIQEPEDEGHAARPYAVTDLDLTPRCPHCANEMEEGDIICLHCGYNTQTRERFQTRKTIEHTGFDWTLWLLPGILCVITVLIFTGFIIFAWLKFDDYYDDNKNEWWVGVAFGMFAKIYSTVISLFIIWFAGRFAVKRLILHPRPPEKVKD